MKHIYPLAFVAFTLGFGAAAQAADDYAPRLKAARETAQKKMSQGMEAYNQELEKQGRELLKEFPDKDEPYGMIISAVRQADPEKKRAVLKEIDTDKTPARSKAQIAGALTQLDALGKPLNIKFTAVDGRQVDLTSMKGKVVLVDFWATWCGPCVAELPNVKAAYDKLHDKGFEIVGISFDKDQSKLESFVKEKAMPWPQYFDGKVWQNDLGQKYGINSIPAMWLIGKDGNLVDMNARAGLAQKVETELAK